MTTTIPPDEVPELAAQAVRFVSASEREEVYQERAPIYVVGAIPRVPGSFGDQVVFLVACPGRWDGRPRKLALAFTDSRAELARGFAGQLSRSGDPDARIGPLQLSKARSRAGHDVWALEAYQETLSDTSRATPDVRADVHIGDH